MDGTAVLRVKRQLIALLQTKLPNVAYSSPTVAAEVMGEDGSGRSIWWSDDIESNESIAIFGGTPLHFDEEAHPTLVIQAIGLNTDDTQDVLDEAVTEMLGEVVAVMGTTPTLGIASDANIQVFTVLPESHKYFGGVIANSNRNAARFELVIGIKARIHLTSS